MAKKPSNLIYGLDESPRLYESIVLGFEHIFIITVSYVFPVIIIQEMGGEPEQAAKMIQMCMIAGGIGVIVQSLKKGPLGSGYLCPQLCGPSFLSASILAAKTAGLGAVFVGTFFGGLFEAILSRFLKRLRAFFPPEVTGTVVAMVGITVIPFAMPRFLGMTEADPRVRAMDIVVAVATLAVMCAATIWGKKKMRLFNILIGMGTGYALSWIFGLFPAEDLARFSSAAVFAAPVPVFYGWHLSWALVLPFVVAALCSTLKSIGDLTTCQKINDAEWKRTDMDSMSGGILADAVGAMSAGLLGGMGQSTSSSNVAMSIATGATSRVIAWSVGILLFVLAFFPKFATIFVIMPTPVMGATLVFTVSFMIVVGFQIISSRMLDARKMLMIGISIILGLSVDMVPGVYAGVPAWIAPIFSSSLSLATISVVLLNVLFRFGIAQRKSIQITPDEVAEDTIYRFLDDQGRAWGARPEIIARAARVSTEFVDSARVQGLIEKEIQATAYFDEFNLDVTLHYEGRQMDWSAAVPTADEVVSDESALARLSAGIIRRSVDRLTSDEKKGLVTVRFHFDH
jgi:xanthine permease XanP